MLLRKIGVRLSSGFLFGLLLILIEGCNQGNGSQMSRGGGDRNMVPIEAQIIKPQVLRNKIYTTGTLLANEEVELRPEISGRVTGVFFQEGKRVKKGELLIKINDRELMAQLKRKQVEEKQASDAENRQQKLFENKLISQEEFDKYVNALQMVKADREAIESQLAETEIMAPFDGIIGLRYVSEGGYVTPDGKVASMQDIDPMKVEFSVPEKYASLIKSGTEILVKVGESDDEYKGTVYAVESKIDQDTRTIRSRAIVPNPGDKLIPGAFAKIEITLQEMADAIVIPSEAIIPQIDGQSVYICENGKAKSIPVKTGIRTEKDIQITDGLSPNDTLIVTGLLQLADGRGVQIKSLRNN